MTNMNFDQAVGHVLALRPGHRQQQRDQDQDRDQQLQHQQHHHRGERKSTSNGSVSGTWGADGDNAREIAHIQETLHELMAQYTSVSENFAALLMTMRLK